MLSITVATHGHRNFETVQVASQPDHGRILCWKYWTLFQEHRPEPVASESIVFLSEKMMERSTSRSLFFMIWQMGNHKLNSETKRILSLFFASRPRMQITVVETRLFYPSKMP